MPPIILEKNNRHIDYVVLPYVLIYSDISLNQTPRGPDLPEY
jgi:hypothetical protein